MAVTASPARKACPARSALETAGDRVMEECSLTGVVLTNVTVTASFAASLPATCGITRTSPGIVPLSSAVYVPFVSVSVKVSLRTSAIPCGAVNEVLTVSALTALPSASCARKVSTAFSVPSGFSVVLSLVTCECCALSCGASTTTEASSRLLRLPFSSSAVTATR